MAAAALGLVPLVAVAVTFEAKAQEAQNPSPMVEHTRAHPRLEPATPEGRRVTLRKGVVLYVPSGVEAPGDPQAMLPLLMHFHGGHWLPEVAAARAGGMACVSVQAGAGSGRYAQLLSGEDSFGALLEEAEKAAGQLLGPVTLSAWSAGCGAVREILRHADNDARIDRVILLDGIHTSYTNGRPGPQESDIDSAKLAPFVRFARQAMAGRKQLLITHTEIFPGTFASTTETADWLLRTLEVPRKAVLRWGPMQTQQLSEARTGRFVLQGFAGNSAPDHVDQLHALPEFLQQPKDE